MKLVIKIAAGIILAVGLLWSSCRTLTPALPPGTPNEPA